jgi:RNA polymerase sigma-70 factor (ECF subfamily)
MDRIAVMLPDEATLIARARTDLTAFAAIYDHYFPRVYNYVRYRVSDAQTSDDLTAQIFERVMAHLGAYRSQRAPFAAWLFAIARNTLNDHLRAQKRRRWLSLDALRQHPGDDPPPDEIAMRNQTRAELLSAVARLSVREREIIALKFGAGLTNRMIAELSGLSESHVGVILFRAVRKLRDELNRSGP